MEDTIVVAVGETRQQLLEIPGGETEEGRDEGERGREKEREKDRENGERQWC